jgi:hypothetical protein
MESKPHDIMHEVYRAMKTLCYVSFHMEKHKFSIRLWFDSRMMKILQLIFIHNQTCRA